MKPPQQPRTVRDDIEQIVSSLIELGIADDQNFPVLRQLSAQGWEITFGGAEHVSIAMGEVDYEVIHLELSDKRSYNVKLLDGGLLQMRCTFLKVNSSSSIDSRIIPRPACAHSRMILIRTCEMSSFWISYRGASCPPPCDLTLIKQPPSTLTIHAATLHWAMFRDVAFLFLLG